MMAIPTWDLTALLGFPLAPAYGRLGSSLLHGSRLALDIMLGVCSVNITLLVTAGGEVPVIALHAAPST